MRWFPSDHDTVVRPFHKLSVQFKVARGQDGVATGDIFLLLFNVLEVGEAAASKSLARRVRRNVGICTEEEETVYI